MRTGPLVIAHRGASGYRPEHTLAAYELAIRLGADYVEPDLVVTRDGVLVARHENEISGTTDVADRPEFAGRRTTKTVDGAAVTGWFTEDFTLDELKTLRATERIPSLRPTNARFDGRFEVPTLQEVIDLTKVASRRRGRTVGICPETKHPSYFHAIGLAPEPLLVRTLRRNGLHRRSSPVLIQSFEPTTLQVLATMTRVRLVQLLGQDTRQATPAGLARIAGYAQGIGVHKHLIVPRSADGYLLDPTSVVDAAHDANLSVLAWTFRDENAFLPVDFRLGPDPGAKGDSTHEYALFRELGVDGVFTDHPDSAVAAMRGRTVERLPA